MYPPLPSSQLLLSFCFVSLYVLNTAISSPTNSDIAEALGRIKRATPQGKPISATNKKPKTVPKSEQMCKKYAEAVFTLEDPVVLVPGAEKMQSDHCAITAQTLIVGGEVANPKEFPHMALIGYGDKPDVIWVCGGSLISDRFILSAAHCAEYKDDSSSFPAQWATLGDLKVLSEGDDADPVTVQIDRIILHPQYNKRLVYNDIALFKLAEKIEFSPYIRPICLFREASVKHKYAIASGWGRTGPSGRPSEDLMKVNLNLTSTASCIKVYPKSNSLPEGIDTTTMLCAGGTPGKDTCQGDSGGPLQVVLAEPYCMYGQVGVTSVGPVCASGDPGVYTRVSHFVPWIEKIVWP